jgi:uncharacterized protein
MLIYQNSTQNFVSDVRENLLADKMRENFEESFGKKVNPSEFRSWENSLRMMRDVIELAELNDNNIVLEYTIPYNQSRLDCLLFGRNQESEDNIALIELKQWDSADAIEATDDEGNFVETYTGGGVRVVPHPSQQAKGYHNYLLNFVSEFENSKKLSLFSCAYCHNYPRVDGEGLFDSIYDKLREEYPVFSKNDLHAFASKLKSLLSTGAGFEVFNRFMQSPVKPSQKLLDNVSKIVKQEVVFSLLNEQLSAKNLIWSKVRKAKKGQAKTAVIVHGGPGTGKSVIAVNLLAEAAQRGFTVFYGCKSKPFTEGLKSLVKGDGSMLFSNLFRFIPSKTEENSIDLLLIDEAHRIEKTSNHRYTRKEDRTEIPQIDQLIRAAKVAVFFIDDKQIVRSSEVGSTQLIRESAKKLICNMEEVTLESQFRCMGSNNYLTWIESVLGYSDESKVLSKNDVFDFRIFDSPSELYAILEEKEQAIPNSARIVAGFCWPWSNPNPDGTLVKDVMIGEFAMPWEAKDNFRLEKGIPKWYQWAYKARGFEQVGCIYTAQGFEFDYIGVIIGPDLVYNQLHDRIEGDVSENSDPMLRRDIENFDDYVRNIYRVLLSRGMKGCYVYFVDKDTEEYFRSRIEK